MHQESPTVIPITVVGYGDGLFVALANSGEGPWTVIETWVS
ncbi:MAG: hypothetical protein O2960_05010 [Verrucomicrobia bacterium]|nr:hypothetical protein [Verrucomicrobiota bacterium]